MDDPIPLSVIIVWRDGREGRANVLGSIADQVGSVGGEVLVATALRDLDARRASFPAVRRAEVNPPLTGPAAWEAGRVAARGATLAFVQARCRYAPGWVTTALLGERASGATLIAGPVDLALGSGLAARAAFLCDYGTVGPRGGAAACNIGVAREALPAIRPGHGLHKMALREGGRRVAWDGRDDCGRRSVRGRVAIAVPTRPALRRAEGRRLAGMRPPGGRARLRGPARIAARPAGERRARPARIRADPGKGAPR